MDRKERDAAFSRCAARIRSANEDYAAKIIDIYGSIDRVHEAQRILKLELGEAETPKLPEAVEQILANDEASTDEELLAHFQNEFGVGYDVATAWIAKRNDYLKV